MARDLALISTLAAWQEYIAEWAKKKGFWDLGGLSWLTAEDLQRLEGLLKAQKQMLMISELGEMLEAIRKPSSSEKIGSGFTQEEEELADLFIRGLDYAGHFNLRLAEAIIAKMEVNEGRPFRHGKAF